MTAQFVLDDIEEIERSTGRRVPPRDVIRLNAIGLRAKANENKYATTCLGYLPRVAQLAPGKFFRQPTIGHEIWLEKVEQFAEDDFETVLAVRAFAMSRATDALPDPFDVDAVRLAVEKFAEDYREFTRDQILAALDYVVRGANPCRGEFAPSVTRNADDERLPDVTEGEDWKECIALGVLHDAKVVLWGINQKELEAMTRQQVEELNEEACVAYDIKLMKHNYMLDYQAAREEVRERLKSVAEETGKEGR